MIEPNEGFPTEWEPFNEDDHWMLWSACAERFDMRKPENIGKHLHDASGVKFVRTCALPNGHRS
ncbi:hypothetical protein [Bradyrhizobium sp. SYSU BS000235]|uniref:hypothetical protein n=1 Tax=Bradyrhizobium sp. SYSU BS000235 TaxID=3411332 RepID=UPI003C729FFA